MFTASEYSNSGNALAETVEAFSFIALYVFFFASPTYAAHVPALVLTGPSFLLLFNVIYEWHFSYRGATRSTSVV